MVRKTKQTPKRVSKKTSARKNLAVQLPGSVKKPRGKGVPFHPGYDPRRNYEGRPDGHTELRELIKNIGAQEIEVTTQAGDTYKAPVVYFMLRDMFMGRDSRDHQNILEHGWGKVKDQLEIDDTGISDDTRAERIAAILDAARARRDGQADSGNPDS